MYSPKSVVLLVFLYGVLQSYGEPTFREDYTYMDRTRSFYKFHELHRSYDAALEICKSEGASLYVPQDETEAAELLNKAYKDLQLLRPPTVWLGVNNLRSNTVFETLDGRPINEVYNKWASGYPKNIEENHCVYMAKSLTLTNHHCVYTFRFYCQYTPKNETSNKSNN